MSKPVDYKALSEELLKALKQEHFMAHGADPFKECETCQLITKAEAK